MELETAGAIVVGVVGTQIVIRIIWKYLEGRKNNHNGKFEILYKRLDSLENRLIDRLDIIYDNIKELRK